MSDGIVFANFGVVKGLPKAVEYLLTDISMELVDIRLKIPGSEQYIAP